MARDWEQWFLELCPFPCETFSGQSYPCPVLPREEAPCPYAAFCRDEEARPGEGGGAGKSGLREVFESSYQGAVAVTRAEPSGSFVVRSEHHFHGKEMFRMSLRRHLYEVLVRPAAQPEARPAGGFCPGLTPDTRLGSYIGYIDLRRHYQSSPLALGLLGVPRKLAVDPDAHLVVGDFGPLFGGPALPCTIYSMQDDRTAGAACAQACIIMVLGMLSDRGARLEGSYTLTQLGFSAEGRVPADAAPPPALREAVAADARIAYVFPAAGGLTPTRIVRVLRTLGADAALVRSPGRPPAPSGGRTRTRRKSWPGG